MDFNFDSMSLSDLFAASDTLGDKYLTPEELEQRDRELTEALSETMESIGYDCEQQ